MPAPRQDRGSMLLVEECYAAEDDRFVEQLRLVDQPKLLAAFADKWKRDSRPWSRQQILAYLNLPLDRPGHQPVVKRLFKHAEAANDDEMMAQFLVAFDRQVRRVIQKRRRWDLRNRRATYLEALDSPRNVLPRDGSVYRDPATGKPLPKRIPPNGKLFTYGTRFYLRRRAWRYFRHIGFRKPEVYPAAIARALIAYRDEDFARGENILDSWGLLHACFGSHDALEFRADHPRLAETRSFAELSSAPAFLAAWKHASSAPVLFELLWRPQSRLVRVWAAQFFTREHFNYLAPVDHLFRLLDHEDAEVQQIGARLLAKAPGLALMPISEWLRLLQTRNSEALSLVCDCFIKHVAAERLSLAQALELACAMAVPVARLGFGYLQKKAIISAEDRAAIVALAEAKCEALSGELAHWALSIIGKKECYQTDSVARFFDSARSGSRDTAWNWLIQDGSPGLDDAVLWSRLIETPYDDLRLRIVDHLDRQASDSRPIDDLRMLWTSVLLGVHRGGRQKAKAVRQVGMAIVADPSRADVLLPVLAVAVRSVRLPEARAGLAAVVGAVESRPELAEAVKRFLPELAAL